MLGFFKKHEGLGPGLFLAATVLICFMITFFVEGISPSDLTIPSGENDELIYYYEVEGVIDHGIPQGYFGTSEITARVMTFGAWSPLLIINFCILGKIFGWTAFKAVIYNLVMLMSAVFLFGFLARPSLKRTVMLALSLSSYTLLMYGVLSVTPEITCYFYAIIFIGLFYSALRDNKSYKRILLFAIAFILTLMRPYYAGLFVPAAYLLYKKHGKKTFVLSGLITGAAFYAYFFIAINFCAASPIGRSFSMVIKKIGVSKGHPFLASQNTYTIMQYVVYYLQRIYEGIRSIVTELKRFFIDGIWGRNYFMFYLLFLLLIILYLRRRKRADKEENLWHLFWILYYIMMTFAVIMFFSGWVADRHLAEFVVMGIFVMAMEAGEDKAGFILLAVLEAAIVYSTLVVPNLPRHYIDSGTREEIAHAGEELAALMPLDKSKGPSWDNTLLWVYTDKVEGEEVEIPWQSLFAVPGGYGFNLVYKDEWLDAHSPVFSRYLAAVPGSDSEKRCINWGGEKVLEYGGVVIYRLR